LGKLPKTELQVLELKAVIFLTADFLGKMPKNLPSRRPSAGPAMIQRGPSALLEFAGGSE
jgi:hypothetical protein